MKILFKAQIKKHRSALTGIFLLSFLSVLSFSLAFSLYQNSYQTVHSEMERVGYGDLTTWVSNVDDIDALKQEIEAVDIVDEVHVQPLIYSGYSINGSHSDNEGELLAYDRTAYDYHFFSDTLDGYKEISSIQPGEIYLSSSMISSFGAKKGDTITFEISRENAGVSFVVAGYFEDPFMGSSMIDMKSFLISQTDYLSLVSSIETSDEFNRIARTGAMIHIDQNTDSIRELNQRLIEDTSISQYREMSYSFDTIQGYMLLLQNIFVGFLFAFGLLLMIVACIVVIHVIRSCLQDERKDIAILKIIGKETRDIRLLLLMTYGLAVFIGALTGGMLSFICIPFVQEGMITSTGILFSNDIHASALACIITCECLISIGIILFFSREVMHIKPMQALRTTFDLSKHSYVRNEIHENTLNMSLAIRQILMQYKSYIGILVITMVLTEFTSIVNAMNSWVGRNGEGLMNSFSVAQHDIGIQPTISDFDYAELDALIEQYTAIADTYEIAMQDGIVEGEDYTINVLDDPGWFHILEGRSVESERELLITETVSEELNAGINETVTVSTNGRNEEYIIVGIYECANGMGTNVGMSKDGYARIGNINENIWCHHYILADDAYRDVIMNEMMNRYQMVADIHDNGWSGLDGIVNSLHLVITLMYALTILIIFITVSLSVHQIFLKETYSFAIYKSFGMTSNQLRISFAYRYLLVPLIGSISGILISVLLDSSIVSLILHQFGISGFYSANTWMPDVLSSVSILALSFAFAFVQAGIIRKIPVSHLLTTE